MTDLESTISSAAQTPKSVTVGTTKVDQQDLGQLIEADKYLQGKQAMANSPQRGLRFNQLVPPGTA